MRTNSVILFAFVAALCAVVMLRDAVAQTTITRYIQGRNNTTNVWWKLGPTLTVSSLGQLDVVANKRRYYNVRLLYDPTQAIWTGVPTTATNVVVYVEGLRYLPGVDYSLSSGMLKALKDNIPTDSIVSADYDQ